MLNWQISDPKLSYNAVTKRYRVDCLVDGEELYFESDIELVPAAEGIVSAFLPHALKERAVLEAPPLDRGFAQNLGPAAQLLRRYWGFDGPDPKSDVIQREPGADCGAVFFTGGVDSFFTLKENLQDIRYLINVHGYDVKLADRERQQKNLAGLQRTANMLGLTVIQVESNLRTLEKFKTLRWGQTFVVALAAVGHLLQKHVSRIYIAGGYQPPPCGSTLELDVLWSSDTLKFKRVDEPDRQQKIEAILDWPPVQQFLAVCWKHFSTELNCGKCEKCLRTQLGIIAAGGDLKTFNAFPEIDLTLELSKLERIPPIMYTSWKDIRKALSDAEQRRLIARLIHRSKWQDRVERLRRLRARTVLSKAQNRLDAKRLNLR